MKSDLQIKFLSYMTQRKKGEGFTLIELLVVIIIIGILAAIALPSFLNQANKAKQSEAKQYTGAVVRTQQSYYMEEGQFATDLNDLAKVVKPKTTNYEYKIDPAPTAKTMNVKGTSSSAALKSYTGGVQIVTVEVKGGDGETRKEATTFGGLCESEEPGGAAPGVTIADNGDVTCAGGKVVKK